MHTSAPPPLAGRHHVLGDASSSATLYFVRTQSLPPAVCRTVQARQRSGIGGCCCQAWSSRGTSSSAIPTACRTPCRPTRPATLLMLSPACSPGMSTFPSVVLPTPYHCTMRFGSTDKVLAECKLKYYRISECTVCLPTPQSCATLKLSILSRHKHN